MAKPRTPTPAEILRVMQDPERITAVLEHNSWRAIDVARALPYYTTWYAVEPVLKQMADWGQIAAIQIKGYRVPRYRLLGG